LIAFTKSAIYITGRAMGGSILVTGLPEGLKSAGHLPKPDGT